MNPFGLKDGDMLLALATLLGNPPDVHDGELALADPADPGRTVPVPDGALDRLEAAGLVEIVEAGAVVTDQGRYWLDRWVRRKFKARGRLVLTSLSGVRRV